MSATITLKVESSVITLQRELFARSTVFEDMFSFPSPIDIAPEGSSEDHPLILEGVDVKAFKVFIRAAQASEIDRTPIPPLGLRYWPKAYELAVRWDMVGLQESLLESLKRKVKPKSAVGYIMLGLHMDHRDIFAMGVRRLLRRTKTIGVSEMLKLGPALTQRLLQDREDCLRHVLKASTRRSQSDSATLKGLEDAEYHDKHDIDFLLYVAAALQSLPAMLPKKQEEYIDVATERLWTSRPGFHTVRQMKGAKGALEKDVLDPLK